MIAVSPPRAGHVHALVMIIFVLSLEGFLNEVWGIAANVHISLSVDSGEAYYNRSVPINLSLERSELTLISKNGHSLEKATYTSSFFSLWLNLERKEIENKGWRPIK